MTKHLLILITLLAVAVGGMGWLLNSKTADYAVLKAQVESLTNAQKQAATRLKNDRAALVAREAKIALQTAALANAQQALSEALQTEKTWSDTDVPPAIQEALLGRSNAPAGDSGGLLDSPDSQGSTQP